MEYSTELIEDLTVEIIRYLQDWGLWDRTIILACGNSYSSDDHWENPDEFRGLSSVVIKNGVDPYEYFDYYDDTEGERKHLFGMRFGSYLEELLCEGFFRVEYEMLNKKVWDFIADNSDVVLQSLDSGEYGYGEDLLAEILSEEGDESKYSMWDPLQYESYEEYAERNELFRREDKDLTPAYTLFDNYEEYRSFLNGDLSMLRNNPELWEMSKRLAASHLDEIEVRSYYVAAQFEKGLEEIFRRFGMHYEYPHDGEIVAIPVDEEFL